MFNAKNSAQCSKYMLSIIQYFQICLSSCVLNFGLLYFLLMKL